MCDFPGFYLTEDTSVEARWFSAGGGRKEKAWNQEDPGGKGS